MKEPNIIYLHIGTPKTGTSAIQTFLADNMPLLEERGVYYRTLPYRFERNVRSERNAHFMFEKVHNEAGEIDFEESEKRKQIGYQMISEGLQKNCQVILTDETFWNGMRGKKWKKMEELMQFAKEQNAVVKIIVYLRCQEQFIYSWWKQNVKTGKTSVEWQEFIKDIPKNLALNYAQHLKVFASYVGRENMIVRRYGKEYFEGESIHLDFLNILGIYSLDGFYIRENEVNKSIDDNCAEIKRILNKISQNEESEGMMMSSYFERIAVSTTQLKDGNEKYSPYTQEELAQLRLRFRKSNEAVRKLYFPEERELFSMPAVKQEKWRKDNSGMNESVVLFFEQMFWSLKKENEDIRLQNEDLRSQVDELRRMIQQDAEKRKKVEKQIPLLKEDIKVLKRLLHPIIWLRNLFR